MAQEWEHQIVEVTSGGIPRVRRALVEEGGKEWELVQVLDARPTEGILLFFVGSGNSAGDFPEILAGSTRGGSSSSRGPGREGRVPRH